MFALSGSDAPLPLEPVRVGVITLVDTANTASIIVELRRDAMQVELVTADALHSPPVMPVYIVSVDPPIAGVLADRIVSWALVSDLRPGLIGLIESGGSRDSEVLLAAGFDDAVLAPASARELAGRVRALHRRVRSKGISNGRLRYGDLTLDLYARTLWTAGKIIALTSIELAVLRELMKARGRPLSRSELLDAAWGEGELEVSERAVDNVILRLRRKLPQPELIETVRSVGFRLSSPA